MAPTNRQVVVFDSFSGGDEGLSRPGGSSNPQTFRALNVWLYENGIGPRQPVTPFPVTGLNQKAVQLFDRVPGEQLIYVFKDKTVQRADTGTAINLTAVTNLPVDSISDGGVQHYVSPDGFGSDYDVVGASMADSLIPAARRIEIFGARVVAFPVTGVSPDAQSIIYSDFGDPTSWPTANNIRIANSDGLTDMWNQGNTIVFTDGQGLIYLLSGNLGDTHILRRVEQAGPVPFIETPFYPQGGVSQVGTAWWRSGSRIVTFNGARVSTIAGYERPSATPVLSNDLPSQFMSLSEEGEFVWVMPQLLSGAGSNTSIGVTTHHAAGAFTQHLIPTNGYTPERDPLVLSTYSKVQRALYITTGGSDTQAPVIYKWLHDASFPSVTHDGDSSAPVTATFRTGDFFAPEGVQLEVHSVTVDYSYAPAQVGSSQVQFDINVEMLSTDDDFATYASAVQSFTPSSMTTDSPDFSLIQRGRRTFGMGEQGSGAGFRVKLANWRGIIVHQLTVAYSTEQFPR